MKDNHSKKLAILQIMLAVLLLVSLSVFAFADEDTLISQLYDTGANDLLDEIPEEVENLLNENNEKITISDIATMTPEHFFGIIKNGIKSAVSEPFKIIGTLAGIILLCGIIAGLKNSFLENNLSQIFSLVAVLSVVSIVSSPIINLILQTGQSLQSCADFILCFIPVFSGIVTAGGQVATAGTYTVILFALCQLVARIAISVIVPLMGVYFALAIIGSVFPDTPLKSITSGTKNLVCWGLGLVMTIFVSLLSIQTLVSQGADGISTKTTKFLIGNFIPIVGGALSDALQTARGCIAFLKSTVGAFGIFVAVMTFLPILLRLVAWYLVSKISCEISTIMGANELTNILKATAQTISILIALLMCFALILVISTTIVMMSCVS